jgi:hypothetical protein
MERAIKEIATSAELANHYQDIAKNLLDQINLNNQNYLFLISLEKSLSYFADEIFEKTQSADSNLIINLSCKAKWESLSENTAIKNIIIPEIATGGVIEQINFYQSSLITPKRDDLISTDSLIDLKKLNELLNRTYRWISLLRKNLDEC